jgi:hypothetical protein
VAHLIRHRRRGDAVGTARSLEVVRGSMSIADHEPFHPAPDDAMSRRLAGSDRDASRRGVLNE